MPSFDLGYKDAEWITKRGMGCKAPPFSSRSRSIIILALSIINIWYIKSKIRYGKNEVRTVNNINFHVKFTEHLVFKGIRFHFKDSWFFFSSDTNEESSDIFICKTKRNYRKSTPRNTERNSSNIFTLVICPLPKNFWKRDWTLISMTKKVEVKFTCFLFG